MKNYKLLSLALVASFLVFQSCEKIKDLLEVTVNVPIEKCQTIIAPQVAGEYSQETSVNLTTKDILEEYSVDASAIRAATPNQLVISIGNPDDTEFEVTDVKSVKVELSTPNKTAVSIVDKAITEATVTDNTATFSGDTNVNLIEYIKEDAITMKVTLTTATDVLTDTELCFELKNDMTIGVPQ